MLGQQTAGTLLAFLVSPGRFGVGKVITNRERDGLFRIHDFAGKHAGLGVGGVQWTAQYLDTAGTELAERVISYKEALGPVQLTEDHELSPASLRLAGHYVVIPAATRATDSINACGYLADGEAAQFYDRTSEDYAQAVRDVISQQRSVLFGKYLRDVEISVLQELLLDRRQALWIEGAKYLTIQGVEFDVDLDRPDSSPVFIQVHRLNAYNRRRTQHHIDRELQLGALAAIQSPCASPCFTVDQSTKPEGRLVCDYRGLNSLTRRTQSHVRLFSALVI